MRRLPGLEQEAQRAQHASEALQEERRAMQGELAALQQALDEVSARVQA